MSIQRAEISNMNTEQSRILSSIQEQLLEKIVNGEEFTREEYGILLDEDSEFYRNLIENILNVVERKKDETYKKPTKENLEGYFEFVLADLSPSQLSEKMEDIEFENGELILDLVDILNREESWKLDNKREILYRKYLQRFTEDELNTELVNNVNVERIQKMFLTIFRNPQHMDNKKLYTDTVKSLLLRSDTRQGDMYFSFMDRDAFFDLVDDEDIEIVRYMTKNRGKELVKMYERFFTQSMDDETLQRVIYQFNTIQSQLPPRVDTKEMSKKEVKEIQRIHVNFNNYAESMFHGLSTQKGMYNLDDDTLLDILDTDFVYEQLSDHSPYFYSLTSTNKRSEFVNRLFLHKLKEGDEEFIKKAVLLEDMDDEYVKRGLFLIDDRDFLLEHRDENEQFRKYVEKMEEADQKMEIGQKIPLYWRGNQGWIHRMKHSYYVSEITETHVTVARKTPTGRYSTAQDKTYTFSKDVFRRTIEQGQDFVAGEMGNRSLRIPDKPIHEIDSFQSYEKRMYNKK